jgi:hypothetical protein
VWNIEQTRRKKEERRDDEKSESGERNERFYSQFFLRSKAITTLKINDFQSCLAIEVMSITWKELLFLDY